MMVTATVIMRVITTDLSENDNTCNDIHDNMKIHSSFLLRFPPLFRLFTPLSRLAFIFSASLLLPLLPFLSPSLPSRLVSYFHFFPSLTPTPFPLSLLLPSLLSSIFLFFSSHLIIVPAPSLSSLHIVWRRAGRAVWEWLMSGM